MSKLVRLSVIGATGAALCIATPIGGSAALAGPVGLAATSGVALPVAAEAVAYRRIYHGRTVFGGRHYGWHKGWHRHALVSGRSAFRGICEQRTAYSPRYIIERRTAYVQPRYIIERRTAYVAAPVVAAYPAYAYGYPYGYGGPGGVVAAGAGLLGGLFDAAAWGAGGWYGPGWRWRY